MIPNCESEPRVGLCQSEPKIGFNDSELRIGPRKYYNSEYYFILLFFLKLGFRIEIQRQQIWRQWNLCL